MNEQIETKPEEPLTETLTVRGPELSNVLEDLRNQGVTLLAVSVVCTSDWSVTIQRKNFSALKPRENQRNHMDTDTTPPTEPKPIKEPCWENDPQFMID